MICNAKKNCLGQMIRAIDHHVYAEENMSWRNNFPITGIDFLVSEDHISQGKKSPGKI